MAYMVASEPVLQNTTRSAQGLASWSSVASFIWETVWMPNIQPSSVLALMAASISGCRWPRMCRPKPTDVSR